MNLFKYYKIQLLSDKYISTFLAHEIQTHFQLECIISNNKENNRFLNFVKKSFSLSVVYVAHLNFV